MGRASSLTRQIIRFAHSSCELQQKGEFRNWSDRSWNRPPDLLDERHSPLQLSPHSKIPAAEPVNAVASFPFFHLEDPSTTILLSSIRDHPIRLNSALDSTLLASYPLVNPTNEKFISPHSLLFATDGTKFLAGSDSLLAVFDSSRPGQEPISWLPTGFRRRRLSLDSGMTMRGIVSALALDNSSGILAAGTFSRCVGLYESEGQGGCIGVFRVDDTSADKSIGGRGVTQLRWSSCGRYLYIVERRSDGAMIYDIRKTGQLLSWLEGRKAMTSQRLGVDVAAGIGEGHQNVWAGGTDGRIRVWQNPHQTEGPQKTKFEWEGHQGRFSPQEKFLHTESG